MALPQSDEIHPRICKGNMLPLKTSLGIDKTPLPENHGKTITIIVEDYWFRDFKDNASLGKIGASWVINFLSINLNDKHWDETCYVTMEIGQGQS